MRKEKVSNKNCLGATAIKLFTNGKDTHIDIDIEGLPNDVLNVLAHATAVVMDSYIDEDKYTKAILMFADTIDKNLKSLEKAEEE